MFLIYIKKCKFNVTCRTFLFIGAGLTLLSGWGCSPSSLFGTGKDSSVLKTTLYRKVNTECANLDLSSSVLTVSDFKSIVRCFNGNGSIKSLNSLINDEQKGLKESELKPLVDFLNTSVLNHKTRLHEIEQTFSSLSESRSGQLPVIDVFFDQLSRVLDNQQFVTSLMGIMKSTAVSGKEGILYLDPEVLKALQIISKKLTPSFWARSIDFGKNLAGSPSFDSLQSHFKKGSARNEAGHHEEKEWVKGVHEYLNDKGGYDLKSNLVKAILDPSKAPSKPDKLLYGFLKSALGQTDTQIKDQTSRLAAVFQETLRVEPGSSGSLMPRLSAAFRDLDQEIPCMKKGKSIPSGVLHFIRELNELQSTAQSEEYVLKDNRLSLLALAPFCSLDSLKLDVHYPALEELAKTGAMPYLADLIKKLDEPTRPKPPGGLAGSDHPLTQLFVKFLSDPAFLKLVPLLEEVAAKKAWSDLLLVVSAPDDQDSQALKEALEFLVTSQAELQGKSILDVLLRVVSSQSVAETVQLISSIGVFIDSADSLLVPGLTAVRSAYYVNDVHPFLNLIQESLRDSSEKSELYNSFIKISENSYFPDVLQEVSTFAKDKDDGLRLLIDTFLKMVHRFVREEASRTPIKALEEPAFTKKPKHIYQGSKEHKANYSGPIALSPVRIGTRNWYTERLESLPKFPFSWNEAAQATAGSPSDPLVRLLLSLEPIEGVNVYTDLSKSVKFLRTEKVDFQPNALSFFNYGVNLSQELFKDSSQSSMQFVVDAWIKDYDRGANGHFMSLLSAVPFWVDDVAGVGTGVLRPLVSLISELYQRAPESIHALETYVGTLLKRDDIPLIASHLEAVLKEEGHEAENAVEDRADADLDAFFEPWREKIKAAVVLKECDRFSGFALGHPAQEEAIHQRVQEIINEAKYNVTNWNLDPPTPPENQAQPRQKWKLEDLKNEMRFVLEKLSSETQTASSHAVVEAPLRFFKHYSGEKEFVVKGPDRLDHAVRYTPEYLLAWFHDRATHYRLINYFYPNESKPRLRLVNDLDLLELVLINVDLVSTLPPHKNLGLDFLAELAEAWGDLPNRDQWPDEIKNRFPDPEHGPKTILEAVKDILKRADRIKGDNAAQKWFTYQAEVAKMGVGMYSILGEDLDFLTNVLELPSLPRCYHDHPYVENVQDEHLVSTDASWKPLRWVSPLLVPNERLPDFQRRLYNLWQTNQILLEHAPGSGKGSQQGGEVLRDMFFEVLYATPFELRKAEVGEKNNLTLLLRIAKMGGLRQMGRMLQKFRNPTTLQPHDPGYLRAQADWKVLQDGFTTVVRIAHQPEALRLLETVVMYGKNDHSPQKFDLIWAVLEQVFQLIDSHSPLELAKMKQLIFYSLGVVNQLEPWHASHQRLPEEDLANLALKNVTRIVDQQRELLIRESDLIREGLTSQTAPRAVRVLYGEDEERKSKLKDFTKMILKDLLESPAGNVPQNEQAPPNLRIDHLMKLLATVSEEGPMKANWTLFKDRRNGLLNDAVYHSDRVDEALWALLHFFEVEHASLAVRTTDGEANKLANRQRLILAKELEANHLSRFLKLSQKTDENGKAQVDPGKVEEIYTLLNTLSQLIGKQNEGPLREFLRKIVRPSLSE